MTLAQQLPLRSGFGRESTADDVMFGVDLTGRTALVTGAVTPGSAWKRPEPSPAPEPT